jgi:hypothetical protein
MSMNESRVPVRSNLTDAQKRAAEAAIYGLPTDLHSMNISPLSHDEIERMRQIVMQHDSEGKRTMNEFDLNNPPKTPYRHQEFPRIVYDHVGRKTLKVRNQAELENAIGAGYELEAFMPEVAEPELSVAERAEVARLDREARRPKKEPK